MAGEVHKPTSGYFSDRCPKTVFGNEIATPCSLKLDHDGPCKPTPLPQQRVSSPHIKLEGRHSAAFVTFQRPCEEALPLLAEAYNKLADDWERMYAALERIRDWRDFRHTGEVRDCAEEALRGR